MRRVLRFTIRTFATVGFIAAIGAMLEPAINRIVATIIGPQAEGYEQHDKE